jgi:hypothetical protein
MHNAVLTDWIQARLQGAELLLSVCTGLLDGLEAMIHHGAIDLLWQVAPRMAVRENARHLDNGKAPTNR